MTACSCSPGITLYAGRDYTAQFTLTTSNPSPSTPYDLTSAKAWLTVKDDTSDLDADALISKSNDLAGGSDSEILILSPATDGVLEVYFVPDDTNGWSEGTYWFDLVIENSAGKRVQAVAPSPFTVKYTVTKISS